MTAYPVARKRKSLDICTAFVKPIKGKVATALQPGPAMFYGVDDSNVAIWREVVRSGRDYFYADNSYFDSRRQLSYRITKNALQHSGIGSSDGRRFRATDVQIEPWRASGDHIVLCPQSEHFMRVVVGAKDDWVPATLQALEQITQRPITVRPWDANKAKLGMTLRADLEAAHALVTWSSAASVTALLAGVPVVTLGQCAAEPMAGGLVQIESLPRPEREEWAGVLADNEWSLSEISNGIAWEHLNG